MTTELAQIKCDIAARKAMPGFGPDTSIERLQIINATQKSFSLETVEALVEALEARDKQIAKDIQIKARLCRESNSLFDRLRAAEKRIAELEARTVKLPDYSETYTTGFASEIEHQVRKVLEMAGVAVEDE